MQNFFVLLSYSSKERKTTKFLLFLQSIRLLLKAKLISLGQQRPRARYGRPHGQPSSSSTAGALTRSKDYYLTIQN
jgi:hypothetical protein